MKVDGKAAKSGGKAQAKGGKGKKSGKKNVSMRSAVLLDGQPISEMTREQLMNHAIRLIEQLEKEREERNFFQLERDQIYGFWKVCKEESEEIRARLRNKEKELEDAEEIRQKDVALYKQQIKYLLHEHQTSQAESQAEHHAALEQAELRFQEQEKLLRDDQNKVKEELRQVYLNQQVAVDRIKLESAGELSNIRKSMEQDVREMETKFQNRLETLRDELEKRRKADLQEVDTKNQEHVKNLKANHEKAIIDLKNCYNDIILNNMTLITALKEQVAELRSKEDRLEKHLATARKESKQLQGTIEQLEKGTKEVKRETDQWQQSKTSLQAVKSQQKTLMKQLETLQWEREMLEQNFVRIKTERDEMEEKFMAAILEVQQKANLKQLVLEKKLEAMQASMREKEQLIKELTSNSSLCLSLEKQSCQEVKSNTEQRKKTVVKMHFDSEDLKNKSPTLRSRGSSIDQFAADERLSTYSSSSRNKGPQSALSSPTNNSSRTTGQSKMLQFSDN